MKNIKEIIDEIVTAILTKNIEYDLSESKGKETKLDAVKEKVESIEKEI